MLVRGNGEPLYTLVNPVDDALMEITHVLRGEDLLPSTPRQIVLYRGARADRRRRRPVPTFGHLPTVLGEGNRRLSKRDKGSGLAEYMERGFLPEALLNYLALLGWAIADDRDIFTIDEMVEAFDIRRVNANPARFDPKKCEAINAAHIRLLRTDELAGGWCRSGAAPGWSATADCRTRRAAGRGDAAGPGADDTLSEAVDCSASCSPPTTTFGSIDAGRKLLGADAGAVLDAAADGARAGRAVRPRRDRGRAAGGPDRRSRAEAEVAFGPVRVAVTGRRISPPLFESLELLGRESSLARIGAAAGRPDARCALMAASMRRTRRQPAVAPASGTAVRPAQPPPRPPALRAARAAPTGRRPQRREPKLPPDGVGTRRSCGPSYALVALDGRRADGAVVLPAADRCDQSAGRVLLGRVARR